MASGSREDEAEVTVADLPLTFKVKYIGSDVALGLWGIKYTRGPVDKMVTGSGILSPMKPLPICNLIVSTKGVNVSFIENLKVRKKHYYYPVDSISYGVQDLIYTRVFAMIIVKDEGSKHPYEVHAFACDNRATARKLTYALATAFQEYSRQVNEGGRLESGATVSKGKQKFAIDLRTAEEMEEDDETEA